MNEQHDEARPVRKICINCKHCIERDDAYERGLCTSPESPNSECMVAFDDSCRQWERRERE